MTGTDEVKIPLGGKDTGSQLGLEEGEGVREERVRESEGISPTVFRASDFDEWLLITNDYLELNCETAC